MPGSPASCSSVFCSASSARIAATIPAATISPAATQLPAKSAVLLPLSTIAPKTTGAAMLAPVATEKKSAIAMPRISTGNSSLTVRYAELAAADATKKTTHQASVCVVAVEPSRKERPPRQRQQHARERVRRRDHHTTSDRVEEPSQDQGPEEVSDGERHHVEPDVLRGHAVEAMRAPGRR